MNFRSWLPAGLLLCACLAPVGAEQAPTPAAPADSVLAAPVAGPIQAEPFGLLQLDVTPGMRRVFLDRETVLHHAENVVITAGEHRLDLIAPAGYADTSLTVTVEDQQTHRLEIQLRNISGLPLPNPAPRISGRTYGPLALVVTSLFSATTMAAILLFTGN